MNAIGQRIGVTTSGTAYPPIPSWLWGYDSLGQVIVADSTVATSDHSNQYDTNGNRQKSADSLTLPVADNYTTNALNQYTTRSAGVSPTFTLKKTRLWGRDLSNTTQAAGGVASLLSESLISNSQSPIYYPTYDGNGDISEYLTATGTIAAHFEYDPFSNTVVNTDTGNLFTYRFSTKPIDIETGLSYYGYRYYEPMTGRWPSRDPIEERGGINLYGFIGNSGVDKWDILGNECCCVYICTKADLFTNSAACRREPGRPEGCAQNIILSPAPSIISPLRLSWSFKSCKDGKTYVQAILQDNWIPVSPDPNLA